MIGEKPVCLECRHFNKENIDGLTCAAFEQGIPDVILVAGNTHKIPIPFQTNDIVFEPIKDAQSESNTN